MWIATDADRVYFAKLVAEVETWRRPGEKLEIAPIEHPFAWRKNYQLLQALQKRGHEKTATEASEQSARSAAATNRLMNEFAADRAALLAFRDANRQQWPDMADFVGLKPDDLVEGPRDERFGEEIGWREKAQRIGGAPRGDQLVTKAGVKSVAGFVETAASLLGAEPVAAGAAIANAAADLLPDDDDDGD